MRIPTTGYLTLALPCGGLSASWSGPVQGTSSYSSSASPPDLIM
jgi:hypothetical protein